ncbi:MAG: DUF6691 family protein [Hyphomicrobium sp.]|jgi:hypothetical protein
MRALSYFVSGLLFGVGLVLSGLISPAKVLAFLDLAGHWDPSLALTLAAAVSVTFLGYKLVLGRAAPIFDHTFHLPQSTSVDIKLIIGAALFGTGWGLVGYCPGPAVAALAYGSAASMIFVCAMLVGMAAARFLAACSLSAVRK